METFSAWYEQGGVVRVSFPSTDRPIRQRKPALVASADGIGEGVGLLWVAMTTSAENRPWPGDGPFGDGTAAAGLPAPSIARPCKLATIEAADADRLGGIPASMLVAVRHAVASSIGRP